MKIIQRTLGLFTSASLPISLFLGGVACSDDAGSTAPPPGAAAPGDAAFESGKELRVTVPESGRVFVRLAEPAVVTPAGDPATSLDWDLALEGLDVFTNSGPSGAGSGGSFGPLDASDFAGDNAPTVPFVSPDKPGGAFLEWYAYDGTSHALWSRYHVAGVRDGARTWKVQVLGYYGQRDGATIPGLYRIRYSELGASGPGPTVELADIDGTAGGTMAPPTAPSECLDLATGARTMLTVDAAKASTAWHLCFRRASVTVNGEAGGPRGIGAVDLSAAATPSEVLTEVETRTAAGSLPGFEAVTSASLPGKVLRGDRVVSGFGDAWINHAASPITPVRATWLAVDRAGTHKFLVAFTAFEKPTTKSPGTVVMRIKPVGG